MNAFRAALLFSLCCLLSCSGPKRLATRPTLLFHDEFDNPDTMLWKAEIAPQPDSKVYVNDGKLYLDTRGGVTVWLNKKLRSGLRIVYRRMVLMDSGVNDRLSDLNTFWMATDPKHYNLFTRDGVLERYDSLLLYYSGMGGNTNKTTRFRKYEGNGERTLLKEYTDAAHLLQPNRWYEITIEVKDDLVSYAVDGETYFSFRDPKVLTEGYFGFRSTKSRQAIDWIRIYRQ